MDSLVVVLVGLGGLYAIAQDKKKEGFSQSTIAHNETSSYPLTDKNKTVVIDAIYK